jgi:hypothetical protein
MQLNYLRRLRLPGQDTLNQSALPPASPEAQHGNQQKQEQAEASSGSDVRKDFSPSKINEGLNDIDTQTPTHHAESDQRPEKCPLPSCQYHTKGFARKSDVNRHTLTHYKGNIVCGFCPGSSTLAEKSFARLDVFKRHLVSVHGVEYTPPNARRRASPERSSNTIGHAGTGNCSTCGNTFSSAQQFYNHLDDCVFSVVQDQSHDNLVAPAVKWDQSSNADKTANEKNNQGNRLGRGAIFSPSLNMMVSASHPDDIRAQSSVPSSQSRQVLESMLEESLEVSQPLVGISLQDSKLDSGHVWKDMTEGFSAEGASSITSAPYGRPSHGNHLSASHHSLVNERLQAANAARSLSPSPASVERSPFKRGSRLAPILDIWNESASRAQMSNRQNPFQQGGDFDTTAIIARQASAMISQESGDEVVPASNNPDTSFDSRLNLPHETPSSIDSLMPVGRNYEGNFQSPPDLKRQQNLQEQALAQQRAQVIAQQRAQVMALQQRRMMLDEELRLAQARINIDSAHLDMVAEAESPKQRLDFATDLPRTISPKHALLDYHDDEYSAYAQPSLQQSQPSIILQRPSMLNRQSDETSSTYFPHLPMPPSGFNADLLSPLHDVAVDFQLQLPLLEEQIEERLSTNSHAMNDDQTRDFVVHNRLKSLLGENSAAQQAHDQPCSLPQTEVLPRDSNPIASTSHLWDAQAEIEYQRSAHSEREALMQQENERSEKARRENDEWSLPTFPLPTLELSQNIPTLELSHNISDAQPQLNWQSAYTEPVFSSRDISGEDNNANFVMEFTSQPEILPPYHLGSSEPREGRNRDIPEDINAVDQTGNLSDMAFDNYGRLRRNASFNQQPDDLEEEDDGQIDCICGFDENDGNIVACDTCNKWQHIICYYPQYGDSLPDELQHWCVKCRPEMSINAQAAHIRQREARADRYGLQNSNKRQKNSKSHKEKTKNAAGAGLTNGWPLDKSQFDDSYPNDRYVDPISRRNRPSPPMVIPRASHHASPYGEEGFKASDHMAAISEASEVRSGRDALEMLYEAAVLGRVDSSAITQRPSYELHNHTSEAPAHASLDAPLWNSEGFYEDSPSPPTNPEVKHKDLGIEESPKEWTFLAGTNGYRTPKHPINPPLRRGKPLSPQEQRMRVTRACFRCRQRKIKCELGVNGCLRCERAKKPCELSSEHSPDNQQAEDARQIPELGHTVSSLLPSSMKHKEQPPVPNLLSGADQETLQSFFHSNDPFSNGDQESLDRQRLLDAAVADQSELQSESRLEETTFAGSANAYDKQLLGRMTHM